MTSMGRMSLHCLTASDVLGQSTTDLATVAMICRAQSKAFPCLGICPLTVGPGAQRLGLITLTAAWTLVASQVLLSSYPSLSHVVTAWESKEALARI